MKLPVHLKKSPLHEATFEIRQEDNIPLSSIIPGILYPLDKNLIIESQVASQIPKAIREKDQNLRYAPVCAIKKDGQILLISDHSISICIPKNYLGWENFKSTIIKYLDIFDKNHLLNKISRISLRYLNLIEPITQSDISQDLKFSACLEKDLLTNSPFSFTATLTNGDNYFSRLQIANPASLNNNEGQHFEGTIIDIDTYFSCSQKYYQENRDSVLDKLHSINKEIFFKTISDNTLDRLGAEYE